jgi:hypothetical protein
MEPAEAPLYPGMLVDDDDNHVARNCAAFVSAAIPERGHDLPRLDAHPLPRNHVADEQILRTEKFLQVLWR